MAKTVDSDKINIIKLAHLHYQAGRWDNTLEEYQKLLEMDPRDMNVHKMMGDVYAKKNDIPRAYAEYNQVAAHFIGLGQTEKAAPVYAKIARLDKKQLPPEAQPKHALIQLRVRADEALEAGQLEEAARALGELLNRNPEDHDAAAKLSELEGKTGETTPAVERYTRLGESFLKSHQFKKAQEMFKKVTALDPQNTAAQVSMAQIYAKQGLDNEAKKEYVNIAEQALAKDDLDTAWDCAGKAVELKSIGAYYILGVVLFKRQKWTEAKAAFDHLLRFKVNHTDAQVYLGKIYSQMNQPDKAVEAFQKALKLDKDGVFALEAWAHYCVKNQENDEAVKAFMILAQKAEAAGQLSQAIAWARRMVSVDSRASSQQFLDRLLQGPEGPVEEVKPVSADPGLTEESLASVFSKQGTVQERRKNYGISAEDSAMTFSLKPGEPVSREAGSSPDSTAVLSAEESAPKELNAPEVNPEEALKAQIGLADQYVQQGLLEEAIVIYQQLLEAEPDHPELKRKLNDLYGVYAKTGTDLTKVFASAAPAEEEMRRLKVDEARKSLKELAALALGEADQQISRALGKKERGEAKKVHLTAAQQTLKTIENGAREEANQRIKAELERRALEKAEKKAGVEKGRLDEKKEKTPPAPPKAPPVFLIAPPPVIQAEKKPNLQKRSNRIGYV
jgi:tetratricopeptide (TPR) repeat protein